MKAYEVKRMIEQYGENVTLKEIFDEFKRPYKCPQCNGDGNYMKEVTVPYPSGLPDSGWVPDSKKFKKTFCDLCNGQGYTTKEYKPKIIQVQSGWE